MPNAAFSKIRDNAYCILEGKTEPLTFPWGCLSLFLLFPIAMLFASVFFSLKMFYELFQL